ncbi:malonic semialdehyde reductase [Thalassospira sp. MCCC 1A01428]|uniref:malonic semialdehyde reductase n=1 Tax=Thalassospira sp. MCCC 1A01428 TaxID=1470575 RepID=UPI000A1FE03A|nr:malonic semialdehyde reductase [Thalassospira sp. MCCC 1A01428]OSQ45856.1 malonic semialdehyde reductase [Thalassospira sp. MCCC 1A01428]
MIDQKALDVLFNKARTHNGWLDKKVDTDLLHKAWDLAVMGPTSANCEPMRVVFVQSEAAKDRLKPFMSEGNAAKTMAAPVTAIIGMDMAFYEKLPQLFPHADARSWFAGNDDLIKATAFRNGSLQGAYLILALRSLGLDCGPMSGFDADGVDGEFFAGTTIKTNFMVNIGYGDASKLFDRSPRLAFNDGASII